MTQWVKVEKPWRQHHLSAGTIVRVASPDGQVHDVVVGEVNEMGGVCDDCRAFGSDDVILAEYDLSEVIKTAEKLAVAQ